MLPNRYRFFLQMKVFQGCSVSDFRANVGTSTFAVKEGIDDCERLQTRSIGVAVDSGTIIALNCL
jgi:hypothetical protein